MYSQSGTNQRGGEGDARPCALLRACTRAPLPVPLGIFTKSHVTVTNKGVQRVHEFLLQDQSAKLLPKERVCNCLKKRIDKTKLRDIKYVYFWVGLCAALVILHISTKLVIFLVCAILFLNMLRFVTFWIKNKHIL